jgi:hypothetical protein
MTQQDLNFARVQNRIGPVVRQFVEQHQSFTLDALNAYCASRVNGFRPDSPGRILRDLRRKGVVNYECVDRAGGRYEVIT